jgi:monofunctional biosynthetic peptidoglycan transglycosylase
MFRKVIRFLWKAFLWFFVASVFVVLVFKFVPIPYTPLMASRAIDNMTAEKELEFSHDWRPLSEISPNLQRAVIASEDATFMTHYGFDFEAMQKAFKNNKEGRRLRGGSTISQQTAKNVFLWQGRSYVRKALEAYFTVLIEIIWGKERIMEVYLNSIEMGPNVYGAQAAAHHWFQTSSENLTRRQAASIAAILPNPRKFKAKNSTAYIERRKSRILKRMQHVKILDY